MYEWDEDKNEANRQKHGLDFSLIAQFDMSTARVVIDERFDYGEPRFRAYGRIEAVGYCVVFTPRGDSTRLISFRRIHEKESRRYGI